MEYTFEKDHQKFIAVDTGWTDNGYSVFEIEDENGVFVTTLMVHPLDSIENAVTC